MWPFSWSSDMNAPHHSTDLKEKRNSCYLICLLNILWPGKLWVHLFIPASQSHSPRVPPIWCHMRTCCLNSPLVFAKLWCITQPLTKHIWFGFCFVLLSTFWNHIYIIGQVVQQTANGSKLTTSTAPHPTAWQLFLRELNPACGNSASFPTYSTDFVGLMPHVSVKKL